MGYSTSWKMWKTRGDFRTCLTCRKNNGIIYDIDEIPNPSPPAHPNCRCIIERLKTIIPGLATKDGLNGADWYLKFYGKLPDYYITSEEAESRGWKSKKGNLGLKCPGKMLFGGIHHNKNRHLPDVPGRIWYEADINYESGFRGTERILFSNDGLIFVTYDHYQTFFEIE